MRKISQFLKKLFARTKYLIQKYVKPSIEVVELLKAAIESPAVPILTAIIPGKIDDAIAGELRWLLPEVLKVLGYADECINSKNGDTVLQCAIAKIRLLSDPARKAAWHSIAAYLSQALADGKLTWSEAVHLAEMTYNEAKGKI